MVINNQFFFSLKTTAINTLAYFLISILFIIINISQFYYVFKN
jgi:hypothetical protein